MEENFIKHLLNSQTLDMNRVFEVISLAVDENQDSILRVMSYLTGFSDMPEIPEHPTNEKWTRGDNAQFMSYNILKNKVTYKYLQSREFKVNDDHIFNDGHVFDNYYDIPYDIRSGKNEGQFITLQWWGVDSTSLQEWI